MVKALFILAPLLWVAGLFILPDPAFFAVLSGLIVGLLLVIGLICAWRAPAAREALQDFWTRIFE